MALRLGESQLTNATRIGSLSRLTPPSSPGRATRSTSTGVTSRPFKSTILEMLDQEMEAMVISPTPSTHSSPAQKSRSKLPEQSVSHTSKPLHPYFLKDTIAQSNDSAAGLNVDITNVPARTFGNSKRAALLSAQGAVDTLSPLEDSTSIQAQYTFRSYAPSPQLIYASDEEEANKFVRQLEGPLGFDLEWCIFIQRNKPAIVRRTAVVQLCDTKTILLVHVSAMKKFPQAVKDVIESPDIVKTGANIRNDGQKLFRDFGILAKNLVELGAFAHQADSEFSSLHRRSIVSLAKMVERYTSKTLDKGNVRISNWERAPLSERQREYAANDAHCALTVYNRLLGMANTSQRELIPLTYTANVETEYREKKYSKDKSTRSTVVGSSLGLDKSSTGPSSSYRRYPAEEVRPGSFPRPQHMRAYTLWHHSDMPLKDICAKLRSEENPLKESTVISYVVGALQANPALPFSTVRLKALAQLEAGSWVRHRDWILRQEASI